MKLAGLFGYVLLCWSASTLKAVAQIRIGQHWDQQIVEPSMKILPVGNNRLQTDTNVVQGRFDARFQPYTESLLKGKSTANWLRLQVTNQSDQAKVLYLGTTRFEYMQCWVNTGSLLSGPQVSGQRLAETQKSVPLPGFSFFSFRCGPNQTVTVYIKAVNRTAPLTPQLIRPFTLTDETAFRNYYERPAGFTFVFLGVALSMLLYNFILFLVTRLRTYLFYLGYVICIAVFSLGLVPQLAAPLFGHLDFNRPPVVYFATLGIVFYILVAQDVMEIKKYYFRLNKLLTVLIGALLVSAALIPIPNTDFRAYINFPSTLIAFACLIFVGFSMTVRRHRPSLLFFMSSSFYLTGVILFILQLLQVLPPNLFHISTDTLFQISISLEMTLASLSLGARINEMRRRLTQEQVAKEKLEQEREQERLQLIETQNSLLEKQVQERTLELQASLEELRRTQRQLVQREKMASLGELTAGIAHEIQNPLNFVTNFAEVSEELIQELRQEIETNASDKVLGLTDNLSSNMDRIRHHGHRAESIVNGMLLHSRVDVGEKQIINLNALLDEYLRLTYQGMRSKEKNFNTQLTVHLAETVGKINCYPQELGRVLINLYTNAFYSVYQKQKKADSTYRPAVTVTSQLAQSSIEIIIYDNGVGIPATVLNKIFQPFFTTKPAGQGTGLGLSISHDIITKSYSGELTARSVENAFAEFVIRLPLTAV